MRNRVAEEIEWASDEAFLPDPRDVYGMRPPERPSCIECDGASGYHRPQMTLPAPTSAPPAAPELCLVVPTFNAEGTIAPLLERLRELGGIDWEVIVVDDNSVDQTVTRVRQLGETNPRVRA